MTVGDGVAGHTGNAATSSADIERLINHMTSVMRSEPPVAEIDSSLIITSCNSEFKKLAGVQALGRRCREVFGCSVEAAQCPAVRASTQGRAVRAREVPCAPWGEVSILPLSGGVREGGMLMLLSRESGVAETLEEVCRALLCRNRRLARFERAVKDTLSIVSHELKTPLTIALGCISLAMAERNDARRDELLEMAKRSLIRQNRIIEKMSELYKLQCGVLRLRLRECDLSEIVETAMLRKLPSAVEKGVRVELSFSCRARVLADPDYLEYAIEEVLDNSIKFNRRGGQVRLEVRRRNGSVELVVQDTGEGIPRDKLELIFEPFYQGDMSTTRKYPGVGLGLTLARKILELHRGSVAVECRKNGEGAVCRITLPQPTSSCCSH